LGLPEGSLLSANNIVIDRNDTARPRRGFSDYGDESPSSQVIKTLINYKDRIIRHVGSSLQYDSDAEDGTFSTFSGTYDEVESGIRMKYVEASGNLYFTTSDGVKKISGTISNNVTNFTTQDKFIKDAGGPAALDIKATLVYEDGGFLPPLSKTAYRALWGYRDSNNNLITGAVSSRTIATNTDSNKETNEVSTVDTNGVLATALDADYFLMSDGDGSNFYVWYNLDGSSTKPSTSETVNRIEIEVAVVTGDTSGTVAARTASAILNSIANVSVEVSGDVITITNNSGSDVTDVADGAGALTGFVFTTVVQGSNSTGKSASVNLTFNIPSDADTTDYLFQLYRTGVTTTTIEDNLADLEPGDEMNLVYEANLTAADIASGEITVKDEIPESFRVSGTLLYTNPVSGEGILQSNEKPPKAADITIFRNSTFYANTSTRHFLQFSMLSAANFVSGTSKFVLGNSSISKEYTFIGATEETEITTTAAASLDGTYFLLNSASNERGYFFWFDTTGSTVEPSDTDTEGRIAIKVVLDPGDTAADVATALATSIDDQTDFSASEASNVVTVINAKNGDSDDATDGITGTSFSFSFNTQGDGEQANTEDGGDVTLSNLISAGQSIDETARSLVRIINSDIDTREATNFDCLAKASLTDGESFLFSDALDANKVQFYYDTTGANATVPTAESGYTLHRIDISGDTTADDVALTTGNEIGGYNSGGSFNTVISTSTVFVENVDIGPATDAADVDTSYTFNITQHGTYESPVSAFYLSGEDDLPGVILLRSKNLSDSEFYIGVQDDGVDITGQFSPVMPNAQSITNIVDLATDPDTVEVTVASHGYSTGDTVYIYNNDLVGSYEIQSTTTNSFVIQATFVSDTTGRVILGSQVSDNEDNPNRVYFSKTSQPEAVPLVNYLDVGGKDDPIERIVALRDNLFVMKTDGVYIITGSSPSTFGVKLLDNSVSIIAPDSAAILNNQIYMLSTQGIATISDGGVGVISRKIEDRIFDVSGSDFNIRTSAFGVGYETDRSYLIWMPTETTDTTGTQVYRYNTFNTSWVRWTGLNATSAVVNESDDKLYLSSGDTGFIRKERKGDGRKDFADSEGDLSIAEQPADATELQVELSSVLEVDQGDVILQTQWVTIAKFNRLLRKLDADVILDDTDYESSLSLTVGAELQDQLIALVAKVAADDPLQTYTVPTGVTFEQLKDEYNVLIGELNSSVGTGYSNYKTVDETTEFEAIILDKNTSKSLVSFEYQMPFIAGPVTYYKGIVSEIEWAPQHFGDPSILKQIPEGTAIFDGNNFVTAELAFATDASMDFESKKFTGRGVGFWGGWVWSENAWGGEGTDVPYRTLIPRNKQRCRYITVKFTHRNARESFSLLGFSLNVRPLSTRAYRGI